MSKQSAKDLDLPALIGGIAQDTSTLVTQQLALLRVEIGQEMRKAGIGITEVAAGGGLAAAGGLLSGMMMAHLLHRATRLPLWTCYGLVGSGVSAASYALLKQGQARIADLHLLPPAESAEALKENVEWLKDQARSNGNQS